MLNSSDQDGSGIPKTEEIVWQLYQVDFHLLGIKTTHPHMFFFSLRVLGNNLKLSPLFHHLDQA